MFKINNLYIPKISALIISIDFLLLVLAFFAGIHLRFAEGQGFTVSFFQDSFYEACIFIFTMIFSMAAMGMYLPETQRDFNTTLFRLMPSVALCFGLMTFIFYIFPETYLGRGALLIVMVLSFIEILIARTLLYKGISVDILRPRTLVLGTGKNANDLINQNGKLPAHHQPKIVGFIPFPGEERHVPATLVVTDKDSLMSLAGKYKAEEIIIAPQERRGGYFPIQELLECKMHGIRVMDIATFYERENGHIRMDSLYPSWFVFGGGFDQSLLRSTIKRIFDLLASLALLMITLPVMLIAALLILLEDGFPIFYRQERVGKSGETFMVLKFRSMRKNAEKDKKPQWAATNDPRITKVGNIIRKLRIDELPQIVNVLKNEMSFVGPRPERPYFVNMLNAQVPYYGVRHSVKPGITGWAQVRYPYGSSVEDAIEKLQYDLYYVKNHSLFLDAVILVLTVEVVLMGKGSR
ncbi:MAG: TIGR03013 family PEP-CTERM/XrtA system glycosyltransferase [Burkholderiales bacterium]|uniref:TIGR03013 family XrtA/PEP-CTERM system glycosyltransferase n=1 Tax=Nitrosomonas sp. TaxID=42353 RepID=UPI001D7E35A9|nr:TIGR03013 family XrtA/PEP-CTERM system glycosyltransferase [Nitrosomonas sp.]MCB1949798.1 TIGR03013 family PEP-CTERM/XrtA system glycosyltransferase [Nitrosomonas sp.]MCP5242874.1 TIGR03013 family PEP-CTERM/XrtA system glycosyltransferase [Burkholderiales bacterium]